ncbi:phage tail tape measure protein [Kitasatospora sp. NPDC054939]
MADRTVNVRLTLDNSDARRGVRQSEQDYRQLGRTAGIAAAEQQNAFARAAASTQRSLAETAAAARTSGRATQQSVTATTATLGRLEAAARDIPTTFASAAGLSARSMGQLATATQAAATSVVASEARMTEATAAAAAGTRASLAARLAAGEALMAQQAALAASASASAAAQGGAFARMAAAGDRAEGAFSAVRTAGVLMLGAFAVASVAAAKFEKAMSGVQAVADATAEEMNQLRDAALDAGRDTAYTASQAAEAEAELAKAGISTADILEGALRGALSLAAAGQLDLAEAATISAQAMNTFGLRGRDVGHVADVLAAGANKSATDVHQLGESLRMGGLLAKQTGLSLEDTVGALAAFADRALIGSDAGTSLKVMLQRLVPQSDEALGVMKQLGFSAYDASGQFVGLSQLAGNLKSSFTNLTPEARNAAFATIFGSDAVRSATILYELGAEGIDKYIGAVTDQGAASRMAAIQLDNLAGDLQKLQGSLEVALIQSGSAANKVLREMVQWVTQVVDAYSNLPGWAQTSTVALLGIGGALALLAGGFMLVLPRIAAFQASLTALTTTMPRLAAAATGTMSLLTGPWGAALGVAVAALTVFGLATADAKEETQSLTEAVKADSNAIGANTRAWVAHKLETDGVLKASKELGISTSTLTDAILGNADAAARVRAELEPMRVEAVAAAQAAAEAGGGQDKWAQALTKVDGALGGLNAQINGAVEAAKREAEAAGGAAGSTGKLGSAAATTAEELADTRTEAEKLSEALDNLNGANISAARAAINMQSSLTELRDAVKENGTSLDITTEKGREVKAAMLDAAAAAQAHAEAVMKQTGSTEQATIVLGEDVEALRKVMQQAGFTKLQIDSLTAAYAQVPAAKVTNISDPGALETIRDLQDLKAKVEAVPPGKTITVRAPNESAIRDLQAIGFTVEQIQGGKDVKVTVPVNDAVNGSTRIQQLINSIKGREVSVDVRYNFPAGLHRAERDGGVLTGFADGGIRATAFAGGGEHHVAQIARPGEWRVWAEPETGGEAYIPLAPGKRGRSAAILADVAARFGLQLMPLARDLIPARQISGGPAPAARYDHSRTTNITLNGARQSAHEQLAELERRLAFIG